MSAGETPVVDAVTVTANPAVDQTVWVPGFRAGEVNRVVREELSPGGKGVNVAAFLSQFGLRVLATGFLGVPNAGLFEAFFRASDIPYRFVSVADPTRTGIKVVDDEAGSTTDINFPGFEIGDGELADLEATLADVVAPGRWVVLAGSLPRGAPADTYRRPIAAARGGGALVALDASGPALADAIDAGPDLAKPNREELEELTGRRLEGRADVAQAAQELARAGVATVVVSMGADGAVFVRDGEAVFAAAPRVRVASTVGAGDAMVSGTVAGTLRGLALADTAALATAFSAVKIAQVGPKLDAAAVEEMARSIEVQRL
jgi:1-phosphofructokinase